MRVLIIIWLWILSKISHWIEWKQVINRSTHDDVIKWKHLPRHWPFVWGIHRFRTQRPMTRSFEVFLICVWINDWVNNREAGDLRRRRAHDDVIVIDGYWAISTWFGNIRTRLMKFMFGHWSMVTTCWNIVFIVWNARFMLLMLPVPFTRGDKVLLHFDGLVQDCGYSSVLATELLQSCA